jgi:hypothetical protein
MLEHSPILTTITIGVVIMSESIYTHTHHIVPKHMGGTDDPSNLVELTVEEHALAHKKLYEKYEKQEDYIAWKALEGQIGKDELLSEIASLAGKKGGAKSKGRKQSKEHISKRMKSIGDVNPFKGKNHTEEAKEKMRKAATGRSNNVKRWLLTIDNNTIIVEDLTAWCKENGYNKHSMYSAHQAKRGYKDITRIEQC